MARKRKREDQLDHLAQELFGYKHLRPGQETALQAILNGQDTLVVMPTGAGKSMIYQTAGQQLEGPTLVVSPLIALQYDQVESIRAHDIGNTALINSSVPNAELQQTCADLKAGKLKFIFLAPEQFNNEEIFEQLKEAKPALFVVDEAHCISEWGHDFRPEYLRLGTIIEALGSPRVLALTATAALPVRNEIIQRLMMKNPRVIIQGFDRPNIWLGVERFQDERTKKQALLEHVAQVEKPGIIYAATRKHAEEVAQALNENKIRAAFYHAGMHPKERESVQTAFMEDELEVIVATTAFGMGVDKANVRFVFHYDISDSLDSYYQEIGRAGRDGKPAKALLFYLPKDLGLRHFLSSSGHVDVEQAELVVEGMREQEEPVHPKELCSQFGISETKLMQILTILEEAGVVETLPTGEVVARKTPTDVEEIAEEVAKKQESHRQVEHSRIEMMRGYAESYTCRRVSLLSYFGEDLGEACGFCDICDEGIHVQESNEEKPFPLKSKVLHTAWGEGLVMHYEGDKIVVLFDSTGYKSLSLQVVLENSLLIAAQ